MASTVTHCRCRRPLPGNLPPHGPHRAMEERMIKMSKSGEGYFWIGGPGEEAFNACSRPASQKRRRAPPTTTSTCTTATAPPGRHGHAAARRHPADGDDRDRSALAGPQFPRPLLAQREWNVVPVSSVIEVQFAMAPGTALVQKRHGGDGITIVAGGDAGTAEGDFASCLVWSTRPGNELPVLMIVTNNGWGISTPACIAARREAHHRPRQGVRHPRRGRRRQRSRSPAGTRSDRAMDYCRHERRPFMLEAMVSRLYGHSSSSGARASTARRTASRCSSSKLLEAGIARPGGHRADPRGGSRGGRGGRRAGDEGAEAAAGGRREVHLRRRARWTRFIPGDYTGLP